MSVAIRVDNLSKSYRLGLTHAGSIRELINGAARRLIGRHETPIVNGIGKNSAKQGSLFWALRDVSFEVGQGEAIGLIGQNGAGKSTLLKILSRITTQTEGLIEIHGRIGSLLEVGTGFHPELTGRENVFLNGAILGMRRAEILRKFDAIVDFAEVGPFIDTPVKRYSSGMYVRLAFAVAAHLEPEILVVDEVLAVGDVAFQRKCLGKMGDVAQHGRTILFVSHNMQAVRSLCKTAVWLKEGRVQQLGDSTSIVEAYIKDSAPAATTEDVNSYIASFPRDPVFRLHHVALEQDGAPTRTMLSDRPVEVCLEFSIQQETAGFHITIQLLDAEGTVLLESINNGDAAELPVTRIGLYQCKAILPAEFLSPRPYVVNIQAGIANVRNCMPDPVCLSFEVQATGRFNRAYPGYVTPGKLAPLLEWKTELLPPVSVS
jgi:lipopolysaccharide transport system ATP-binding protein